VTDCPASLQSADGKLRAMAAGQDVPVHDVMISLEQARMQLMFMVEVRNRAVEAYQELMRMQL
jgi:flagellar hook-basal body complex protein FliE